MARPRREAAHPNIAAAIKSVARQQMSERGTAGLSLRAIARELEITAPAIYNYYPRLDDLITALIVDAFQSLADAMQASVVRSTNRNIASAFSRCRWPIASGPWSTRSISS